MEESQDPTFFKTSQELRNWFQSNADKETVLWVGFYKKDSGIPCINWSESVDQALCFGWIDGIRKSVDEKSYKIRFTPRRPKSHWSKVNLNKMKVLIENKQMTAAGLLVFERRDKSNTGKASFEQKKVALSPALQRQFAEHATAFDNFKSMPNWVQKGSIHWVMSAKRSDTVQKRLHVLIECSAKGIKIPSLRRPDEK